MRPSKATVSKRMVTRACVGLSPCGNDSICVLALPSQTSLSRRIYDNVINLRQRLQFYGIIYAVQEDWQFWLQRFNYYSWYLSEDMVHVFNKMFLNSHHVYIFFLQVFSLHVCYLEHKKVHIKLTQSTTPFTSWISKKFCASSSYGFDGITCPVPFWWYDLPIAVICLSWCTT